MKYVNHLLLSLVFFVICFFAKAQDEETPYKGMRFDAGNGRTFVLNFTNQVWVRYANTNPGSTVDGTPQDHIFDVGLRRTRLVLQGNLSDRTYIYTQLGMNNFNYLSQRKSGLFFHDAVADYRLSSEKQLHIGAGLTAWGGISRYSIPSIATTLGVDAPLFAQTTNDANDQFLRKLSVFIKGDLGKFSYALAVSKPMAMQQSPLYTGYLKNSSTFSDKAPNPQTHGYFQYAFFDTENHNTPYREGTHLGKKKVLNLGAGFLFQKNGMNRLSQIGDTIYENLGAFSVDLFYDAPTQKGGAINFYAAYFRYFYGEKYLRNIGAMNMANGNNNPQIVNQGGSAFPSIGTGHLFYAQGGFLFPKKENKNPGIMPYTAFTLANYEALNDLVFHYDMGVNILIQEHRSKLILAYQNRPIFKTSDQGSNDFYTRRGLWIAMFQIAI